MRTLTVLGSTGSIGTNTLDVVRRNRHQYQVYGLAAGQNVDTLVSQILEFHPKVAILATSEAMGRLSNRLVAAGLPRAELPRLSYGGRGRVQVGTAIEVCTGISGIV